MASLPRQKLIFKSRTWLGAWPHWLFLLKAFRACGVHACHLARSFTFDTSDARLFL